MAPLNAQYIFGHDGNCGAQSVRPEGRRAKQNTYADSADVRARRMHPLVEENLAQHQFGRDTYRDRERSPLVAFENPERQVPHQQDVGNENRSNIAIVETDELLPPGVRGRWRSQGRGRRLAHAGSLILYSWTAAGLSMFCSLP